MGWGPGWVKRKKLFSSQALVGEEGQLPPRQEPVFRICCQSCLPHSTPGMARERKHDPA